jgi:hypothetical protein
MKTLLISAILLAANCPSAGVDCFWYQDERGRNCAICPDGRCGVSVRCYG